MKALKVIILLVFLQSIASASVDCHDSFFQVNEIQDSKSFVIHDENLKSDFEVEPIAYVKEAILDLIEKAPGCQEKVSANQNKSIPMDINVVCRELIPGKAYSSSCIAESELGYFFVNQDMLGNVNLVFNRWD
ncbi:MAG: hypothetical protein BM556_12720 [Bacteriovorax sp. MedPE-SWde]|nr:MAG: hypothetical protein BM556_12720 [Bacteriovorax sp. MedPE-SWde]